MAKYLVGILWETEVEADSEGYALEKAEDKFSFYKEAEAEIIEDEEE